MGLRRHHFQLFLSLILVVSMSACSARAYRVDMESQPSIEERAALQEQAGVVVRAAVPSDQEIDNVFGLPLYESGIQPIWLEIHNETDVQARFAPYSVDREYFPAHEVAYKHRSLFSKDSLPEIERHLHALTIPRFIKPGATVSGYVFTHAEPGTKAFNVDVHFLPKDVPDRHFTFFIDVPGFTPDHAGVDFKGLYEPGQIENLTEAELRDRIADLPCCMADLNGVANGRPLNLVLVGDGRTVLKALLRAKWTERSLEKSSIYLNNIDYYLGRPPDAVFRKLRDEGSGRNELTLWMAPFRLDEKQVWVGHAKHAISRLFDLREYFFGVRLDPDADEGRNYLLQDLWYAQALESFAFSRSGIAVDDTGPNVDDYGNAWFSDGYRFVLWIAPEPISLRTTNNRNWDSIDTDRGARP